MEHTHAVLHAYATHFCVHKLFEKEKNNVAIIQKPCNIGLLLIPRSVVAKQEGLKNLVRESAGDVEQCHQFLKNQSMKYSEMNVQCQKGNIARAFASYLPKIAELLFAEDGTEYCDRHRVVAESLCYKKGNTIIPRSYRIR